MSDHNLELLTAYIDGELTRRESIAVLRLLNQSSEARRVLWQLQANSQVVKQLPAKTLPADFSTHIVEILKKTAAGAPGPGHDSQAPVPAAARFGSRAAVRLAWAAGLLLAVGGSVLYYFSGTQDRPQIVKNDEKPPQDAPPIGPREDAPKDKEQPKPFDGRFVFAELKQPAQQERLVKDLSTGPAFRVDLVVKNNAQAVVRIKTKLNFEANLKKNKDQELRIFVENLVPVDVAGFLGELASEDKGNFERMQVQPLSGDDQKLLCGLLGIDVDKLAHPVERTKLPDLIEGKGKLPILPPPVQARTPQRRAVLLARDNGKQIQNFVDQRTRLKPGTVQILFVMQTATPGVAAAEQEPIYLVLNFTSSNVHRP